MRMTFAGFLAPILMTVEVAVGCPTFESIDQIFQSFGYNDESRQAVKCLSSLPDESKIFSSASSKLPELRLVFESRLNIITIKSDEISNECDRACTFERKVAGLRDGLFRVDFPTKYLPPKQRLAFRECFAGPSRAETDREKIRR